MTHCDKCRWTGPFKSLGRHRWKHASVRRSTLRNLKKAQRAPRRKRKSVPSAASRRARSSKGDAAVKGKSGVWRIPRGAGSITIRIG